MTSFKSLSRAGLVTFLGLLSTSQTWAQDVSKSAGIKELEAFEQSAYIASMPKSSVKFNLTMPLLNSFTTTCLSQNPKLFASETRTSALVENTVLLRLKKRLNFVDINSSTGEAYLLGIPSDVQYLICTMMIWTGETGVSNDFEDKRVSQDLLFKALTSPETNISVIEHLYPTFTKSPDLTNQMIEGFFLNLFNREETSLKLLIHITDQISRNQTDNNFNITKTFLRKLQSSETFKRFPVYFTKKVLDSLNLSSLSKLQRKEIILESLQNLETSIVLNEVFNSIFAWDFSENQLVELYKQNKITMTSQQQYNLLTALMVSFKIVSKPTTDEIWQALHSPKLSGPQKRDLRSLIISDSKNQNKYGSDFVWNVVLLELQNRTRDEAMTSVLLALIRGTTLTAEQKSTILNTVARDNNFTTQKIQDLVRYLEYALLTKSVNAEDVKIAINKIILSAPKDQRTREFMLRFITQVPNNSSTEDVVLEVLGNYSINESEGTTIIIWSIESGSINAPRIISAVIEKVGISQQIGRVLAQIANHLAKQEQFKTILEYVMNHPDTEANVKGMIRYKLTGEMPSLDLNDFK